MLLSLEKCELPNLIKLHILRFIENIFFLPKFRENRIQFFSEENKCKMKFNQKHL